MKDLFNRLLDRLSEYFAHRKGFLLMLGAVLVVLNWVIQFMPAAGWLARTDLLLHIGVLVVIFGIMLAWAL